MKSLASTSVAYPVYLRCKYCARHAAHTDGLQCIQEEAVLVSQVTLHGDPKAKLTKGQEVGCGMIGGAGPLASDPCAQHAGHPSQLMSVL